MSNLAERIGPGDVLCTREGPKLISGAIRLGARMLRLPSGWNHVVIVHHHDPATGIWWGIEGRPGGTGWRDLTGVLRDPTTLANEGQLRDEGARFLIATAAEKLLGAPYDWAAIRADARIAMRMHHLAKLPEWAEGTQPAEVVCSSYADWCYEFCQQANPGGVEQTRTTTPGHWADFMLHRRWER